MAARPCRQPVWMQSPPGQSDWVTAMAPFWMVTVLLPYGLSTVKLWSCARETRRTKNAVGPNFCRLGPFLGPEEERQARQEQPAQQANPNSGFDHGPISSKAQPEKRSASPAVT